MSELPTWGIDGPTFLVLYAVLVAATAAGIWLRRRSLANAGSEGPLKRGDLDVYELALLNGGPRLAITIAAAKLHRLGALSSASGASIMASGRPAADSEAAGDLEQEVYDAVEREPGTSLGSLRKRLESSAPVRHRAARLNDAGLLLDDATFDRIRWQWLWLVPVLWLGGARLVAGIQNDRSVELLVVALFVTAVIACAFARIRSHATTRGRKLLDAERAGRANLERSPRQEDLPMAVALFGAGALWAADPALASAWDIPRESVAAAGSGSRSSCGASCGSGGGCGGCGG